MSQAVANLIERTDKALAGLEADAIAEMNLALTNSYMQLEQKLLAAYPKYSSEALPGLLANQRSLLLFDELKTVLDVSSMEAVKPALEKMYGQVLGTASEEGTTLSEELIKLRGGDSFVTSTAKIPIEVVAQAAKNAAELVVGKDADFKKEARYLIIQGLAMGNGGRKVASQIRQRLGVTKGRAEGIARTEINRAQNEAAKANYKANGLEFFQSIATADGRICGYCGDRNGNVYELEAGSIPWHVRCLVPGTQVAASLVNATTERHYQGQVITMKTALGYTLTVTPNHPILTPQGWVAAGRLRQGLEVFSSAQPEQIVQAIAPNPYNQPTPIEEIVASFNEDRRATGNFPVTVSVLDGDFHGDGVGSETCTLSSLGGRRQIGRERESLRQAFHEFAGEISRDRIVEFSQRHYEGLVYNLETDTGWYFAEGILTHNCRCYAAPWSPQWEDEGLTDDKWVQEFHDEGLTLLEKQGGKANKGPTYFERQAGMTAAPKPVWTAGKGYQVDKAKLLADDPGLLKKKAEAAAKEAAELAAKKKAEAVEKKAKAEAKKKAEAEAKKAAAEKKTAELAAKKKAEEKAKAEAEAKKKAEELAKKKADEEKAKKEAELAAEKAKEKAAKKKAEKGGKVDPLVQKRLKIDELDVERSYLVKAAGEVAVNAAEANIQRVLDEADQFVMVPNSVLESILESGRLKNSLQLFDDEFGALRRKVEKLGGTYNLSDDQAYELFKDMEDDAYERFEAGYEKFERRLGQEAQMFDGAIEKEPPEKRPVYGYLGGRDYKAGQAHKATLNYGDVSLRLKPKVKERSTAQLDNSDYGRLPSSINQVNVASFNRQVGQVNQGKLAEGNELKQSKMKADIELAKSVKNVDELLKSTDAGFVEFQAHGGIETSDIAEMVFFKGKRPTPEVEKWAKENGVKITFADAPDNDKKEPKVEKPKKAAEAKAEVAKKKAEELAAKKAEAKKKAEAEAKKKAEAEAKKKAEAEAKKKAEAEAKKKAEAEAKKKAEANKKTSSIKFPTDPDSGLELVKTLGGSTGAALVRETKTGNLFVYKKGASPGHLREEFAADELYRSLGIAVPKGKLYETVDGPVKLTQYIEGRTLGELRGQEREQAIAQIKKGFAADALLGNWDVIGASKDNVLVDANGKVYRIDNGGALRYRAQGDPKGDLWNAIPEEIWSLRQFNAEVFGGLSIKDIAAQADALKKKQASIKSAIAKHPETAEVLAKRLDNLLAIGSAYKEHAKKGVAPEQMETILRNILQMKAAEAQAQAAANKVSKVYGASDHDIAFDTAEYAKAVGITEKEASARFRAIRRFTDDEYTEVRESQRIGQDNQSAKDIEAYLATAIPFKGEVFRGMSLTSEKVFYKVINGKGVGAEFTEVTMNSWSSSSSVSEKFARASVNTPISVLFRVENKHGASIVNLSEYEHEDEVLTPKNRKYRVMEIKKAALNPIMYGPNAKGARFDVTLEEITDE